MCNKDDLVSYLYDDLDRPARAAFEAHLRGCAECREELEAMRGVRADLLMWSPPEPDFAFRIVNEPRAAQARNEPRAAQARNEPRAAHAENVLRPTVPSWRAWFTPAAGLAAAAVLVLAAAAGLARIEIHNGPDGWTLRTGAPVPAAEVSVAGFGGVRARDVNLTAASDAEAWASIERRISALETASRDTAGLRSASATGARSTDVDLLKIVRDLLAQSEKQQKTEFALRIAQVMRDIDLKRAADLNNVRVGIGKIDASVTEEAAAHRELMNYILNSNSGSTSPSKK